MTEYPHRDPNRRDSLLTIEEVAALIRMPVATLRYWRVLGTGPRGFIIGGGCATCARTSSTGSTSDATSLATVPPEFSTTEAIGRAHPRPPCYVEPMSKQPTPKQRRSQRGSVEDRWRKRVKDEAGTTLEVASAVAGKVTRWRARYVDNAGREHSRTFDRKVDAQKWLDAQLAALLRGDHIAPRDARLTVGEWWTSS